MSRRDPEHHLVDLLSRASRECNARLAERLKPHGLSVQEGYILRSISAGDGKSLGELAEELVVNNPTLTKMVDRMVDNNLVYRAPHPSDRRRVLIYPTDHGESLGLQVAGIVDQHQKDLEGRFGERSQLGKLLTRLLDSLG